MSDQEKENRNTKINGDQETRDENRYRFMDQTIKKRPVERKSVFIRILSVLGAGAAIGLIASLVFTLTQPALRENISEIGNSGKVTIPPDESAALQSRETDILTDDGSTDTEDGTSGSADQADESEISVEAGPGITESASSAANPKEDIQQSPGNDPEGPAGEAVGKEELPESEPPAETDLEMTEAEPEGITLKEYRQLYTDMMEVAEIPEHALVQVIGITREMDYFNQNYENQRQLSGLIAATTERDLYILTEYRVVDKVERIQVVFCNGAMTDAIFQKTDPGTGLAILKVPLDNIGEETKSELVTAPLGNSYQVSRGEPVLALGSPLGFHGSIAYGIVTSNNTKATVADAEYPLLTTDIDGSADGSGVLVDLDGEIVGFITSSFGNSTGGITGLGISSLKKLIEDLSNNEVRNYVGILGQEVTQDITDRTGIPRGLLVTEVEQDSPAMLGGIKEYDVIVRIGDQSVDNMRNYQKVLQGLKADDSVRVTAMRRGAEGFAEINFEVTVEGR